jgi:hypothetical protein
MALKLRDPKTLKAGGAFAGVGVAKFKLPPSPLKLQVGNPYNTILTVERRTHVATRYSYNTARLWPAPKNLVPYCTTYRTGSPIITAVFYTVRYFNFNTVASVL